jgi:hypothetical protein
MEVLNNLLRQIKICKNKFFRLEKIIQITIIVVIIALIVLIIRDIEKAAQTGDWLAGFAGALAFLWLVAGFRQQQNEITMQREEITMQREALELQALELKNANKISTYNHIQQLTNDSLNNFMNSSINIKEHSELFMIVLEEFKINKIIFSTSVDKVEIEQAWRKWWKFEQELNNFITKIAFALKLYIEYKTNIQVEQKLDISFIDKYIEQMREIPYLEQFYGTFNNLVVTIKSIQPTFKMFQLAGTLSLLIYQDKETRDTMIDFVQDLKEELDNNSISYPAILEIYNNQDIT